jgi:site-specific DNA recombinase
VKPAVIYARVSSDKQKEEHTIASQTEALRGFALEQGFSVPDEWVIEDEGYSGATLVRPGLERVRDLAAEGQIDAVLVYSPDRLSRKYAYQVLLIEEFARHNVQAVFIKAPQTATPEDQLLLQFQGMIAEYERAQILERSRRGKRHRALQGVVNVLCGAPYGYQYIRKTEHAPASYAVIDAEASVVRKVYEYYTVAGLSIGAITRLLNEQGIPTRKRISRWERSVVWAMLRNPAYKGTACFNKTKTAKRQRITRPIRLRGGLASRDSAHHERPREEWIEIAVPPIVTEETFALAAERLQANKDHAPRRTITPSVVQGLVSCRNCSYGLYRTSTRTSARMIYYYRCLGSDAWRRLGGPVCDSKPIRQDLLDELVWREILKLLEGPHLIQEELERRLAAARNASPVKQREENLQRELTRVGKSMERLMTAYQEDLMSLDDLRRRIPELRKRGQAISAELNAIENQLADRAGYLRLAETVTSFLARLRETAKTLDVAERQRIVRLLVKEILVDNDTIVIRHSIPAPTESTEGSRRPISHQKGRQVPDHANYLLRSGSHLTTAGKSLHAPVCTGMENARAGAKPRLSHRDLCRRLCATNAPTQGGAELCERWR